MEIIRREMVNNSIGVLNKKGEIYRALAFTEKKLLFTKHCNTQPKEEAEFVDLNVI